VQNGGFTNLSQPEPLTRELSQNVMSQPQWDSQVIEYDQPKTVPEPLQP
jgi:hypothetical protein